MCLVGSIIMGLVGSKKCTMHGGRLHDCEFQIYVIVRGGSSSSSSSSSRSSKFMHICWLKVIASVTIASAETSLPWESVPWKAGKGEATKEVNHMENIALMCMC